VEKDSALSKGGLGGPRGSGGEGERRGRGVGERKEGSAHLEGAGAFPAQGVLGGAQLGRVLAQVREVGHRLQAVRERESREREGERERRWEEC